MTVNKKIIFLILSLIPLNNCVQSTAFVGPALTMASTEKVIKKSLNDDDKKRLIEESIEEVLREMESRGV